MLDLLKQPWPWYIAGPLIGLAVPALLLAGNKALGISSTFRQICAACFPGNVPFLKYDWKKETWNLFFAAGILIGGFLGGFVFRSPEPVAISAKTVQDLQALGISHQPGLLPHDIFNWQNLRTLPGIILIAGGGFLIGFGTRYSGGCTSGHGVMGLSTLQLYSLVALMAFFVGGIVTTFFLLPGILMALQ